MYGTSISWDFQFHDLELLVPEERPFHKRDDVGGIKIRKGAFLFTPRKIFTSVISHAVSYVK